MKIYISGPITGTKSYLERFELAEQTLKAAGHEVVNPAKVNMNLPESTTHEEYMKMSFVMLDMCDIIFFLNGWEKSKGATMEFNYAMQKGHTIAFEGREEQCQKVLRPKSESLRKKPGKRFITGIVQSVFFAK